MNLFFWRKKKPVEMVSLRDHLDQTKQIKINGVVFHIRKISMEDHAEGLEVLYQFWSAYKKAPKQAPNDPATIIKLRKFMRDFIYAGVARPRLTLKNPPGELIHVDEVMKDMEMAQKLTFAIIDYTWSKKK